MRRVRTLVLALLLVVSAGAAGWIAGQRMKSPAQIAADAEPPSPSRITVPVELKTITSAIVTRGDVRFDAPVSVRLREAPALVAGVSIVTAAPEAGIVLAEGDRALEVSNRPVFVLQGELPMFRTIRPGDEGEDVEQLEMALLRLGFDPGPADGVFDSASGAALQEWYRSRGYETLGPSEEEVAALAAAEGAVRAATDDVANATWDLAEAGRGPDRVTVLSGRAEVRNAEWALTDTRGEVAAADAAAAAQVASAEAVVTRATDALTQAEKRLAAAEAGTHPDTDLPPTRLELEALEVAIELAAADLFQAELAVKEARQSQEATRKQGARRIREANDALAIAKAMYSESVAKPDTSRQQSELETASSRLEAAQADLEGVQAKVGIAAVHSEIVFVRTLPARVNAVAVERGDDAPVKVMELTSSRLVIDSRLSIAEARMAAEGDLVMIEDPYSGVETTGRISAKAVSPTDGRVDIEVFPDEDISQLNGVNVKLTIPIETTGGDVMAVPLAALSAAPDGSARVQVEDDDESTRFIAVTTGLQAAGYAEVIPADGASLSVGDRVVVGLDYTQES